MQDVALDANDQWIKCVLNVKFIVFHTNFEKYLNSELQKISKAQKFSYVQKNCQKKFRMAKNSHSDFFLIIFPKKTGTHLEWPKLAVLNFSDYFAQKDWYKFRTAKNGCSKFFPTVFPKKTV